MKITGTIQERVTQALDFAKKHNKHKPEFDANNEWIDAVREKEQEE